MPSHDVVLYAAEALVPERVVRFVKEGLEQGEMVIVIATPDHRYDLKTRLMAENLIGLSAPRDDAYVTLDAATTLSLFLLDDRPDERLFLDVMAQVMESTSRGRSVRVYGEMVAVLWERGDYGAALRLEHLWNQLVNGRPFSLLCGYPASAVQHADGSLVRDMCACHTGVHDAGPEALASS